MGQLAFKLPHLNLISRSHLLGIFMSRWDNSLSVVNVIYCEILKDSHTNSLMVFSC